MRADTKQVRAGLAAGPLLLAAVAAGVLGLLFFWREVLHSSNFASLSLPVVAIVAATASTFNPCSLPALPGLVAATAAAGTGAERRTKVMVSLAASAGAGAVVLAIGLLVAAVGAGTKDVAEQYFRWVQLGVGLVLVAVAVLHLAGQTSRLPLVAGLTRLGGRVWEAGVANPSPRACLGWGAGFVAVGAG